MKMKIKNLKTWKIISKNRIKNIKKKKWINNRITGDWKITADTDNFSKENFVIGCNLLKINF